MLTRRGLITGLVALVAAPAVIRTPGLLMPVRGFENASGWIQIRHGAWKKGDMAEWLYVHDASDVISWAEKEPQDEIICTMTVFDKPTFSDNPKRRAYVNCEAVRPNNAALIAAGGQFKPIRMLTA